MKIIMLVQEEHLPLPEQITLLQNFGSEGIVDAEHRSHRGESMYLSAEPQAFIDWLGGFEGVWLTDNPMVGDWRIHHIKEKLLA